MLRYLARPAHLLKQHYARAALVFRDERPRDHQCDGFLLHHARRRDIVLLFLLVTGVALTDGIDVLTLVPILGKLQAGGEGGWSRHIETMLGFTPNIPPTAATDGRAGDAADRIDVRPAGRGSQDPDQGLDTLRARTFAAVIHAEWRWRSGAD